MKRTSKLPQSIKQLNFKFQLGESNGHLLSVVWKTEYCDWQCFNDFLVSTWSVLLCDWDWETEEIVWLISYIILFFS